MKGLDPYYVNFEISYDLQVYSIHVLSFDFLLFHLESHDGHYCGTVLKMAINYLIGQHDNTVDLMR